MRQIVPGQQIPEPGPLPDLTGLGRALVGLDDWQPLSEGRTERPG